MNCKHVQELLPLFTGRDLDQNRATLVTAHMQSCAACAASAREYRESQQLLQQFATPQFSEAVYSGIRQRVLREISEQPVAPTLGESIAGWFRPRARWAIATVLLLAVSGLAFYLIATRTNGPQQISKGNDQRETSSTGSKPTVSPSPSNRQSHGPTSPAANPDAGGGRTGAGPLDGRYQFQRRKSSRAAAGPGPHTPDVRVITPDIRVIAAQTSPQSKPPVAPNTAADPASEKTLRVDIQTSDQNIRIIWFTHQPAKQGSPGKSSKRIQEVSSHA